MIETIQNVEEQFKTINSMVNTQSYGVQLKDENFIQQLSIAVEEAYVSLNDGMCEELKACQSCSYQRNYLRNMMGIFNEIEAGVTLSTTVKRELFTFPEKIQEVLERIQRVLKEL
ncbi:MAG: hypothetical protein PF439_00720 [Helicobacteraceae bacterium]|jgi:hypothetical protein|nr:hypothetical protein [Helicobacteraceae bacterium]